MTWLRLLKQDGWRKSRVLCRRVESVDIVCRIFSSRICVEGPGIWNIPAIRVAVYRRRTLDNVAILRSSVRVSNPARE